ncbi:MAG TPA: hypothetical protein VD902_13955 [Symbiobacteriaceae bacterium]|nr:hypothetical protein [Symbiobacteriaceae bacterium]
MNVRRLAWVLGAAIIVAMALYFRPAPTVDWPRSPGQAVFQIDTFPGSPATLFMAEVHVPDLTVFGDGRVTFAQATCSARAACSTL